MSEIEQLSKGFADAVEMAGPAIVMVNARRRFPASGTVFSENAVLTASHVVEREEDIQVTLADGSQVNAKLAGRDTASDLALLKLEKGGLTPSKRAQGTARVGQIVLAVGRPTPEGLQASLGVVSAVGGPVRTERGGRLEKYYQTDAIPYPGFSGGPLIDVQGQLLGINTSGFTPGSSLVIPSDIAWQIGDSLNQIGRVRRGYLGIRSQPVELPQSTKALLRRDQTRGLLLVGIESGAPAEKVGLIVGDVLVDLAGKPVIDHDTLMSILSGDLVGKEVPIEVLRGGVPQVYNITISEKE